MDTEILNQKIIETLKTVFDPELPVNIYDLGLIYKIDIDSDKNITVEMTLTSPTCPIADKIIDEVKTKISRIESANNVTVNIVFDPPWDMTRMSEEVQLELGLL